MLIVHNKFNLRKLSIPSDHMEIVGVLLSIPGQLNIISVYRSPLCEITPFKTNMLSFMKWCCDIPMCIVGDFSDNILLNSTGPIFKKITEQGCA